MELSPRPKRAFGAGKSRHKEREGRVTQLAISATAVLLKVQKIRTVEAAEVALNVVRVWEPKPKPGQPEIEWLLLTSESIDSVPDLKRVVNIYRSGWAIEEYFKALKTGCGFERRQLESFGTLKNAFAIFIPIAWRLLLVRAVSRLSPNAPAQTILTSIQLKLLRHKLNAKQPFQSAEQATYGLARLGGHLKRILPAFSSSVMTRLAVRCAPPRRPLARESAHPARGTRALHRRHARTPIEEE